MNTCQGEFNTSTSELLLHGLVYNYYSQSNQCWVLLKMQSYLVNEGIQAVFLANCACRCQSTYEIYAQEPHHIPLAITPNDEPGENWNMSLDTSSWSNSCYCRSSFISNARNHSQVLQITESTPVLSEQSLYHSPTTTIASLVTDSTPQCQTMPQ